MLNIKQLVAKMFALFQLKSMIKINEYDTSPRIWSCCMSSFMCSSLASMFTLDRTRSMKLGHGNTGKFNVVLRHVGNVATTASRKPLAHGRLCNSTCQRLMNIQTIKHAKLKHVLLVTNEVCYPSIHTIYFTAQNIV